MPVTRTVARKWCGSHVVGLLTTLNFGDGPDFQAEFLGSQMGLKGSSAGELVLITGRMTTERTRGICLYFSAAPGLLPSSQPPISCLEEGAGNAILNPRMAEDYVRVWSQKGFGLTLEELALCSSRLFSSSSMAFSAFLLLCASTQCQESY